MKKRSSIKLPVRLINRKWLILILKLASDMLIINVSFISGYLLRFGVINPLSVPVFMYTRILVFITLTWMVIFNLAGLYKIQPDNSPRIDGLFAVTTAVISSAFFTYVIVLSLYKEALYSKEIILFSSAIALVLFNISRTAIWIFLTKGKSE